MTCLQIYHFGVKATRERFMEPDLVDTTDHYILADDYKTALNHIARIMENGGWKINNISCKTLNLFDIRKKRYLVFHKSYGDSYRIGKRYLINDRGYIIDEYNRESSYDAEFLMRCCDADIIEE